MDINGLVLERDKVYKMNYIHIICIQIGRKRMLFTAVTFNCFCVARHIAFEDKQNDISFLLIQIFNCSGDASRGYSAHKIHE